MVDMSAQDTFSEIEIYLYKSRILSSVSLRKMNAMEGVGITNVTIFNIERHKNYNMNSLLNYIKILEKRLYANDVEIVDLAALGKVFREMREKEGLSVLALYAKTGILPKTIVNIENGRNYSKLTLFKYLEVFPVKFKITD